MEVLVALAGRGEDVDADEVVAGLGHGELAGVVGDVGGEASVGHLDVADEAVDLGRRAHHHGEALVVSPCVGADAVADAGFKGDAGGDEVVDGGGVGLAGVVEPGVGRCGGGGVPEGCAVVVGVDEGEGLEAGFGLEVLEVWHGLALGAYFHGGLHGAAHADAVVGHDLVGVLAVGVDLVGVGVGLSGGGVVEGLYDDALAHDVDLGHLGQGLAGAGLGGGLEGDGDVAGASAIVWLYKGVGDLGGSLGLGAADDVDVHQLDEREPLLGAGVDAEVVVAVGGHGELGLEVGVVLGDLCLGDDFLCHSGHGGGGADAHLHGRGVCVGVACRD